MRSFGLTSLRHVLRKNAILHGIYMRLKRYINSELVGMTSKSEQDYLASFGREIYAGDGEVVDLGCWLGSTTISLVDGLSKNPLFVNSGQKVYAYDLFVWFNWMNDSLSGTNLVGKYVEGDSFLEEFEARISDVAEHIEIRAGDLTEIGWHGGRIEFLLIDAMKSWELANGIMNNFFPHLVPGSLVFQQDFASRLVPWIHVIQWKFRDHFEMLEDIPRSQSIVFRLIQPIPADLLAEELSFESFSAEEVKDAFDYFLAVVSPEKRPNVAAAEATWFLHQNKITEAAAVYDRRIRQNIPLKDDMLIVKELVEVIENKK
jgi:hypothetical protein